MRQGEAKSYRQNFWLQRALRENIANDIAMRSLSEGRIGDIMACIYFTAGTIATSMLQSQSLKTRNEIEAKQKVKTQHWGRFPWCESKSKSFFNQSDMMKLYLVQSNYVHDCIQCRLERKAHTGTYGRAWYLTQSDAMVVVVVG